jgi:hypothetical protein
MQLSCTSRGSVSLGADHFHNRVELELCMNKIVSKDQYIQSTRL